MEFHHKSNKGLEANLSAEEMLRRYEHDRLHERHQGHEKMHTEMLLILVITMAVAQICLVEWKKRWFNSYQRATLIGMWVIPVLFSCYQHWWRFIIAWATFSAITFVIVQKATRKPVEGTTPRLVYRWFLYIYKASYSLGLIGYIAIMMALMGFNIMFHIKISDWMDFGIMCLFYGLYFGVMGRDFAEICTDTMASRIGYYSPSGIPLRQLDHGVCAVCGTSIAHDGEGVESSYKLDCNHVFHEFCIRGWCIIGKKQTCPYCKEKVELTRVFSNPWERPHVMYGYLLDWIRYLVAWQPLILTSVQVINWSLGLE